MKKIDITVVQKPDYIIYHCPYCNEDVEISYDNFEDLIGEEYCDWTYSSIECPRCNHKLEIDGIEWD